MVLVTKHSNDKNMVTKSVGKIASNVNEVKLIIIGSSNAYRFLEHLDKQLQDIITMQKCSKAEIFKANMEGLVENDKRVIVTTIKNFMADAVRGLMRSKKSRDGD